MAGMFIGRRIIWNRLREKCNRLDDVIAFDEDLTANNPRFTFLDFAPTIKVNDHTEGFKTADNSQLIEFANKWLLNTDCWDVISVETVAANISLIINERGIVEEKGILNTFSVTADANEERAKLQSQIRALHKSRVAVEFKVQMLRLWIKKFDVSPDDKVRPIIPQLAFKDFLPKRLTNDNNSDNQFESLDAVMERVNEAVRNEEINGKILNVQTLALSAGQDWSVNSASTQTKSWIGKIVYIVRVFYALGPICEEEVGFADFVPQCLSGGNLFKRPKFESQSDLLTKASKWLADNPEINFCSAQSIDVKLKSMVSIDTKQMAVTRKTGDYVRIMRIAFTKPNEPSEDLPLSSHLPPPPPVYLQSQLFVVQSYADVKQSLAQFLARDEWSAEQQYKWLLLNCETLCVMTNNNDRSTLEANSDQSFQAISSSKLSINRNLFFAVKLYYDVGYYGVDHIDTKADRSPIGDHSGEDSSKSCGLI